MRKLSFILQKEFRQIFRNPAIIRIIFIMPAIQLLLLPLAADYEVKNVNVDIIDHDHSDLSRRFTEKVEASGYFNLVNYSEDYSGALHDVEKDDADLIIEIPANFSRDLIRENAAQMLLSVNAVNGAKGNIGASYVAALIRDFNDEVRNELIQFPKFNPEPVISVTSSNWYNPHMNYHLFMVPGILVILLTMVGSFLAALNIVHEKEIGTIEQINVTPLRKYQFILGKLIPFWLLGFVVLTIGFLIARFVYGIIPAGSFLLIYSFAAVYLLALLGIGLLISTFAETQQQAMFISFFFIMIFILLGGLYTSIDSMPKWAQVVTKFNPVSYFIDVMRMVVLKGSRFGDIRYHFMMIGIMAVVFNTLAILSYRKRA